MRVGLIAVIFVGMLSSVASAAAQGKFRLEDENGQRVDPFDVTAGTKAIVFIFTSVECPISNRYAPAVQRLQRRFAAHGVQFWLVYPNPADSPAMIKRHLRDFSYPMRALRDPKHELVKFVGATVTPEAAIYHSTGRMMYRGRIDDRYVSLGVERPAAMRRDLEEALSATLAGKTVSDPVTNAVGCFIADFVRVPRASTGASIAVVFISLGVRTPSPSSIRSHGGAGVSVDEGCDRPYNWALVHDP